MIKRILALMGKEFIQIKRDRRTLVMIIAIPLLWLIIFGYAAELNVRHLKLIVRNEAQNDLAGIVVDAFKASDSFSIVGNNFRSQDEVKEQLRLDKADLALIIPPGFGDAGAEAPIRVLVDGADFFSAQSAVGLVQKALQSAQAEIQAAALAAAKTQVQAKLAQALPVPAQMMLSSGMIDVNALVDTLPASMPKLVPEMEFLYNPDVRSAIFMIPGIAAMVILFITVLMTALGVVRERERGTLEQLVVSPLRPVELMVGKILPYSLIGLLDFTLVLVAAIYLFDIPFAGNLAVFYIVTVFFLLSALGLGLVASAAAQNQQQAMQMAMFTVFPQMLISGVIFPLEAMPAPIVAIAKVLPLTYYVPVARGMFIKGLGIETLQSQAIALVVYGLAMIAVASVIFRRKLD